MSGYAQQAESGQAEAGVFDRSRRLFEEVVAGLANPGCGELTHAQLEDQLTERSRELMRSLFQDHLDLRTSREQRRPEGAPSADGVVRARAERGHQRELATVFGTRRSPWPQPPTWPASTLSGNPPPARMPTALVSNGDFDAYRHHHLDQEHHHTRYRDNYQLAA